MSDLLEYRGEARVPPPPDEADATPRFVQPRIPNLGHALLFFAFTGITLFAFEMLVVLVAGWPTTSRSGHLTIEHPNLQIAAEAATYLVALLVAWVFFPRLWHRSFLDGIRWDSSAACNRLARLSLLGLLLGIASGIVDYFITSSKPPPIEEFFLRPTTAWLITIFGIAVAPVFEEICFRGFLLPAFAIAYDWLRLPRTEAARADWHATTALSPAAYIFSAILSSILFAALHGQQVAYAWGAIAVLFSVSLILTLVRVRTQSVAASTIVHATYNSCIFLVTIVQTGGYRHLDRMAH